MELAENPIDGIMKSLVMMTDNTALRKGDIGIMIHIVHTIMALMIIQIAATGRTIIGTSGNTVEIEDHIIREMTIIINLDITGIWHKKNLHSSSKACIRVCSLSLKLKRRSHKATLI